LIGSKNDLTAKDAKEREENRKTRFIRE